MHRKDAKSELKHYLIDTLKKSKDPMSALTDIFGKDHAPKIVRLMNNLELYEQALDKVSKKEKYSGSMQDEYAARAETTANNIQLLKNTISKLGITIGSVLLPPLNTFLTTVAPLVSGVADFARENEGLTTGLAMGAAGFVALRVGAVVFRYLASVGKTSMLQVGGAVAGARRALSIPWPFSPIRNGLQSIARNSQSAVRRMRQLGPAGMLAATGAGGLRMLGVAGRMAAGGVRTLGSAFKMAFGPVSLLVMGLSYGVDYVIGNWEKIAPYFTKLWDKVKSIFTAALAWLQPIFDKVGGFVSTIGDKLGSIGAGFSSGVKSVKGFFGFGDDEEEKQEAAPARAADAAPKPAPLPKPAAAAVQQAQAATVKITTRSQVEQETRQTAKEQMAKPAREQDPARSARSGQQPQINVSVNITQNGVPDKTFAQGVIRAIRSEGQKAIEEIVTRIVGDQARLAYGG